MRFAPGVVRTRPGTSVLFPLSGLTTGMFNWIAPSGNNYVVYRKGSTIEAYKQGTGPQTILASIGSTYRPSFADLDVWLYVAGYDTEGRGTFQTRIFSDVVSVDRAFAPPIRFASGVVDLLADGSCTVGVHYIGFVYQNRSGFLGVPTTNISYAITATTGASPDVITAPGNTVVDGSVVVIRGALGDTAINGEQLIVADVGVAGAGTFHLKDAAGSYINGNGVYAGGGVLFDPLVIEVTSAANAKIRVTLTLPARDDGGPNPGGGNATLFMIATPVDNPDAWFFVPPATGTSSTVNQQPVPLNTVTTLTFIMDCSDATLEQGDSALDQFLLFSQNTLGQGPFNPNFVVAYGQRMVYGNGTTAYASDINQPQQIAPDRNAVQMPNQRYIGYAFPLPGGTDLYLTGLGWTARVTDNSDIPATWAQPIKVSDAIGTNLPNLVQARTGGGYVWIATEAGLYIFNGVYQDRPMTYMISDVWNSINWNASYAIEITDDVKNLKVYVSVPLGTSTTCNALIVIDYQNCADNPVYDQVDVSVDVLSPLNFGSIGTILEQATGLTNLWIGPATAGSMLHFDSDNLNDVNTAIHWFWESGLVRGNKEIQSALIRIGQQMVWARGHTATPEQLVITIYGPDRRRFVQPKLTSLQGILSTLSDEPGISYMTKSDLNRIENFTTRFEGNSLGAWLELSSFSPYYKPSSSNR